MTPRFVLFGALALALSGCGDTIGETVELPLTARGVQETSFSSGSWQITFDRAEVAFGPLYLCPASVPSDELCETALLELTETASVDALDPSPQDLPPLRGTTGTVRSALWDYGISWPLTFSGPTANAGAPRGHSARFSGQASDGARTLFFEADVDVFSNAPGRLATGQVTEHRVDDARSRLSIVFDLPAWWRSVDFDALADAAFADAPDPTTATVELGANSPAYGSLVHEMTAGARPLFQWSLSDD